MPETGDPRHPSSLETQKNPVGNPPLFPPHPSASLCSFNRVYALSIGKRRPSSPPQSRVQRASVDRFSFIWTLRVFCEAWGPLGQGFLTGKITRDMTFDDPNDLRKDFPRFTPEALEANFKVVDFLKDLAARKKITPAQIALAWLLAQKPWIVPIPGGTKMEHLDDNLPAVEVRMSAEDLREIDQAFATIDIKGAPLSKALDAAIDR
jgi:Aldo/keto reductase family